ncbi:hypothetical protein E5K00_18490 [Hymenobacter aquaticus]|uniref:Lipocalin-like domain-containing protein n=1 Tax=Hymenobacter aquaticus TaxID=1867101 RepID=A0A4Z0PX02_9BACT|nr:hypothetical protein [Hymenobacter aquaticus]TGE22237.1 hypothetical protein E5K00_18490 [Hymenobacter aquaticus]
MPRTIYLFLLSLLVFCSACKKEKEEAKPAPALEGRWEYKSTTEYTYDANGKVVSQKESVNPDPYHMDITTTTLTYIDARTNQPESYPSNIKREGDILYFLPGTSTKGQILNLTEHTLTLRYDNRWGNPGAALLYAFDEHYVR